jgi:hypothetical protein
MRNGRKIPVLAAIALACLLASARAAADVFNPVSKYRKVMPLAGLWKYNPQDRKEFSAPDYDDAKWQNATVPAGLKNGGKAGAGWYRKSFTLPRDAAYDWLRFEQILDEGEVWVNGVKLINPKFQPPLEDRQIGVYAHIWTFIWPEVFQAGDALRYGGNNTIAVHVTDDPARTAAEIAIHEEPTLKGISGLTGGVSLIGHPKTFIRAAERIAPRKTSASGVCEHIFRAVTATTAIGRKTIKVNLTVFAENGAQVFDKTNSVKIDPNGSVTEFRWQTAPRYEKYRAVFRLDDGEGNADEVTLGFHGTLVQTSGRELLVNGQPYRIKGVEGLPGLLYTGGAKSGTLKTTWMRDDLVRLAAIGANTLRVADPPVALVREAANNGIMVVPIVHSQWARTVLALRDFKNILYWDIEGGNSQEIATMLPAIAALDSYHRPISYSGGLDIDLDNREFQLVSIRGFQVSKKNNAVCGNPGWEPKNDHPGVLTGWGAAGGARDGYEALRAAPELRRLWNSCVTTNKTRGAFYANFAERSSGYPGLRPFDSMKFNTFMAEVLQSLFSDFDVSTSRASMGGWTADFTYSGSATANGVRAIPAEGNKTPPAQRDTLPRGQALRIIMGPNDKEMPTVNIEYETNGGVPHNFAFDGDAPALDPGAATLAIEKQPFMPGRDNAVRLVITGGHDKRDTEVLFAADNTTAVVKPARRGVSIPASERVSVPFTVNSGKIHGAFLLTAVIRFTDFPGQPLKTYFPLLPKGK